VNGAIGQLLPSAVGVAISPLAIVAVVLMLITPRGRVNAPSFVVGWIAGLVVVGGIVLTVAGGAGAGSGGPAATWVRVLKIVLGVLLLALAAAQWRPGPERRKSRRRPASSTAPPVERMPPTSMASFPVA
jgi:hypothetical protein